MYHKHCHHIIEARDKLIHNNLNNTWVNLVAFEFHDLFKIAAVAYFHKDVVSCICLDSFPHFDNILTFNIVLILNFAHDQFFLRWAKSRPLNHFASVKFGLIARMQVR